MIKRISGGFNIFTREKKIVYASLPIPYTGPSLSRDHQTVNSNNNESKYIRFLNVWAKNRNARGKSCYPALMGNCLTCSRLS